MSKNMIDDSSSTAATKKPSKKSQFAKPIKQLIFICQWLVLGAFLLVLLSQLSSANASETAKNVTKESFVQLYSVFDYPAEQQQLATLTETVSLSNQQTQGDFSQTRYLAVLKRPLNSAGSFAFSPTQGMIWHQSSPFTTTMIMQGQRLITLDANNQIQQTLTAANSNPIAAKIPQLMQQLLTGDINALQQSFSLFYQVPTEENLWTLGLMPKDEPLQQALGKLVIQGDHQLKRIVILSPQAPQNTTGDITDIIFNNVDHGAFSPQNLNWFKLASEEQTVK
ncbi:outer membrane lipoprotein carrier protein LolA [Shewanella gaetbuli]